MKQVGFVILFYALLGLFTFLFKKRTPEEYAASAARHPAWFWSRATAFWQLVGGLGLDPMKVAEAAMKLVTGRVAPLTVGIVAAKTPSSRPPPAGPGGGGGSTAPSAANDPFSGLPVIHGMDDDYEDDPTPSTKPETPAAKRILRRFALVAALVAAVVVVALCVVACAPTSTAPSTAADSKAARAQRAELEYGAELQACVIQAKARMIDNSDASKRKALAEADECADIVRRAWGLADGGASPPDAGTREGGAS